MDSLLQNAGDIIKQLNKMTGLSVKTIKWYIETSKYIIHANPLLHGSCKVRTHVYKWKNDKDLKTPELLV